MRDTVIFDFGGVVTSSPFEAFARLERERNLPTDLIRRINAADRDGNAWARFERAEIDARTFDAEFAEEARALGHELRGDDVLAVLAGDIRPRMVHALDWLKRNGYHLGCITNNVPAGEGAGMARTIEKAAAVAADEAPRPWAARSSTRSRCRPMAPPGARPWLRARANPRRPRFRLSRSKRNSSGSPKRVPRHPRPPGPSSGSAFTRDADQPVSFPPASTP